MRSSSAALAIAFALAGGASLIAAPSANAQSDDDRATARALGVEGQQALDNKSYATAEDRFRRADKLVHAPTLELGLARALAAEAKYVEAQETYNRMIREGLAPGAPEVFKRALEDAKKEVEAVSPKLGTVLITVKTANGQDVTDPKVNLDDRTINAASLGIKRAIDPGPHSLRVTADGFKPVELRFAVLEGGSATQAVTMEKDATAVAAATPVPTAAPAANPATPPPAGQPASTPSSSDTGAPKKSVLPIVAFSVGGAGLLLGTITGIVALGDHSSIAKNCPTTSTCPSTESSAISGYHTMGAISDVGFILAGIGGAVGAILLLTQPKDSGEGSPAPSAPPPAAGLHLYPVVGLGSAGVSGTF
jgi:hypothetical protein